MARRTILTYTPKNIPFVPDIAAKMVTEAIYNSLDCEDQSNLYTDLLSDFTVFRDEFDDYDKVVLIWSHDGMASSICFEEDRPAGMDDCIEIEKEGKDVVVTKNMSR